MGRIVSLLLLFNLLNWHCIASEKEEVPTEDARILVGAERISEYLPLIQKKKVGMLVNHTSLLGLPGNETHLLDTLLALDVQVLKIFTPEHGFRGKADAGEQVNSSIDKATGLPIVSLYGSHKKPTAEDLEGIEIMLFDIQDVGARFYTYISTMHYIMEACAENGIQLIVLDRPNPNGYYIDGPILEPEFKSFVGMHPVPIVHGMTVGEYAQMINGEGWLEGNITCDLQVIPCSSYAHGSYYKIRHSPSPNLRTMNAIYWYPSLCLFEGTVISVGRGTDTPFEVIGHPSFANLDYYFVPKSTEGAKNPKLKDQACYGYNLSETHKDEHMARKAMDLSWLLNMYNRYPDKDEFFNNFFNTLAGTGKLQQQIKEGKSANQIRASWQEGLAKFAIMRKQYLLYTDFRD